MPGYILASLFIMALIAPSITAVLTDVTCYRSLTRMWMVGATAELITVGLSVGVIGYTHYVGWWSDGRAMFGFVVIAVVATIANVMGICGAFDLRDHLRKEGPVLLRRVS